MKRLMNEEQMFYLKQFNKSVSGICLGKKCEECSLLYKNQCIAVILTGIEVEQKFYSELTEEEKEEMKRKEIKDNAFKK